MTKKYIAFDCFDTLVHRDCHPETILRMWANNISAFLKLEIDSEEIYNIRKQCENKYRRELLKEEITYEELMHAVYEKIFFDEKRSGITEELFTKKSYQYEISIECRHLYIDVENVELLKTYYNKKYKIILISDFYMGYNFFETILKYFNLFHYFTGLYISADYGKRKSSGNLYKLVLEDLNIKATEMMMIGDNKESDYNIPRKMMIDAMQIKYKTNSGYVNKKKLCVSLKALLLNNKESLFSGFIPAFILMMDNLYKEATARGCRHLLFCSREGQKLKEMFDYYQSTFYCETLISTDYFFVSRRATLLPSLDCVTKEDFNHIFRQYNELVIKDFLYSIGFSFAEIDALSKKIQFDKDTIISTPNKCEFLVNLVHNEIFVAEYEKKRIEQKKKILLYIKDINCELKELFLVDVGWKGTIQDNLYNVCNGEYDLTGFYFGLFDCQHMKHNKKVGLLFDNIEKNKYFSVFSYNCIELERVLAANHGPVLSYSQVDKKVVPVISKDNRDLEIYSYVHKWQDQMLNDFKETVKLISNSKYNIPCLKSDLIYMYLWNLCVSVPKNKKIFLNFRKKVKENFGNVSGKKVKVEKSFNRDKQMKKAYYFVDYSYQLLDKYGLFFLYPFAALYCRLVYLIKKGQLWLKK